MLDVNPETVCQISARARQFQVEVGDPIAEGAEDSLEPGTGPGPLDEREDLGYLDLKAAVDDLAPAQQADLVAVMWVGRGDYEAEDFEAARAAARDAWTPRTAEYLMSTPLAADYLEEGLAQLGYSCED